MSSMDNDPQAKAFFESVTAKDFPDGELIGACKAIYANLRSHPYGGWKDVHDRFHHYILTEKSGDPELMLAFIKDPATGPIFGGGCLTALFFRVHRDRPGIEAMQREGSAAFLANIPAYGKLSGAWSEKSCIYHYAEAIPVEFHEQYGLHVTTDEYRIDDGLGGLSELSVTIVHKGKTYYY